MQSTTLVRPSARMPGRVGTSLKTVLLTVTGLLAGFAIAGLSYQAVQSVDHYAAAAALDQSNAAGNRLVAGIYEMLLERRPFRHGVGRANNS